MNISSIIRLESRTSSKNFTNKSMSFYCHYNALEFLTEHKEVMLVHTCNKTGLQRKWIINGVNLFNNLEVRMWRKKPICVFRY